jgi:hypothetical protein
MKHYGTFKKPVRQFDPRRRRKYHAYFLSYSMSIIKKKIFSLTPVMDIPLPSKQETGNRGARVD